MRATCTLTCHAVGQPSAAGSSAARTSGQPDTRNLDCSLPGLRPARRGRGLVVTPAPLKADTARAAHFRHLQSIASTHTRHDRVKHANEISKFSQPRPMRPHASSATTRRNAAPSAPSETLPPRMRTAPTALHKRYKHTQCAWHTAPPPRGACVSRHTINEAESTEGQRWPQGQTTRSPLT